MKEAEDIIISKRFFELTPGELEAVKELAANEDDYEAMRWFLQSTKDTFAEEKIEPSKDLRKNVLAHLAQQKPGQTIWLNSAGAFLFPTQKKFYQYPAFQLAAAAVILVGFVFIYDGTIKGDKELAINNNEQIISDNKIVAGGEETPEDNKELANQITPDVSKAETGKDRLEQPLPGTVSRNSELDLRDVTVSPDVNNNYALMSVAEESRMVSNEKLLLEEQQQYGYTNTYSPDQNLYRAGDKAVVTKTIDNVSVVPADDLVLKDELKKESNNNSKTDRSDEDSKSSVLSGTITGPASASTVTNGVTTVGGNTGSGSTTVTSTDNEKAYDEGGKYKTATAGGVFGDTASESEMDAEKKLEIEIPAKDFSLSQTKELRGLFFVVK